MKMNSVRVSFMLKNDMCCVVLSCVSSRELNNILFSHISHVLFIPHTIIIVSLVMQRLAILEEEKNAADKLIEEEYQKRMDNEDKYYLEKRQVLMDAITDVQTNVYGGGDDDDDGDKKKEEGSEKKLLEESGPKFSA